MNKVFIFILTALVFSFIYKFENAVKITISDDVKNNTSSLKKTPKVLSASEKSFVHDVKFITSFQDLETKFKGLSSEKVLNLSLKAQKELSSLDQMSYAQFSEKQLQVYSEVLRRRIVLKKLIFMEKYGKWAGK